MYDLTIYKSFTLAGKSYTHQQTLSKPDMIGKEETIPVAQPGVLTVRTDANTGSLTMTNSGHGILTADKIDLYWTNTDGTFGSRRNMTVGTVASLVVPIDLGSGDDLPAAATAIIAAVVQSFDISIIGNDITALVASADFTRATIVLLSGGTTEELAIVLISGGAYGWVTGDGTNPIAGDTINKVNMTIADVTTARLVRVAAQLDE